MARTHPISSSTFQISSQQAFQFFSGFRQFLRETLLFGQCELIFAGENFVRQSVQCVADNVFPGAGTKDQADGRKAGGRSVTMVAGRFLKLTQPMCQHLRVERFHFLTTSSAMTPSSSTRPMMTGSS